MLQAHSLLWHYLWLAPHVLQIVLAFFLWQRGLHKRFPIFFAYLLFEAAEEFLLYGMDLLPSVSGESFWRAFSIGLIIEGILKCGVIGELFSHLLRARPVLAKVGGRLISGAGAAFVLLATVAAAYAPMNHPIYIVMYRAHILLQSLYIVESGLVLFLFLFAAHFKLTWNHQAFGIALGFGIVFCQHMGAWAVMATGAWADSHRIVEFLNMATYHFCVLLWFYYFFVPQKSVTTSAVALPENSLAMWNRELERLLQQ
jgi:hypothetical protein